MTTDELASYYANLLILQYIKKPKAYAMIKAVVLPFLMDQFPLLVQDAFNIDDAIGVQLDVLGKYVGASRIGNTTGGLVTLGDDDFRILIKFLIIKNNSGSSLGTIQSLLASAFPGKVRVSDNQLMQLNYLITEDLGSANLLEILVSAGYLPTPMAVQVSAVIVPSFSTTYFGFRNYSAPDTTVAPFNSYAIYQTTYPWLTY